MASLEIIMSYSRKHYSALTVNGPGHLYKKPEKLRVIRSVYSDNLFLSFFLSFFFFFSFSRIVRSVYRGGFCARKKADAEERSGAAGAGPLRPGRAPRGGWGWWPGALAGCRGQTPPWAASSTLPFPDCSDLLRRPVASSSGHLRAPADPSPRLLGDETRDP